MDMHSEINPTYSPRVALIYRPAPNHSIRVSGSVAYRPPTLIETNADIRINTNISSLNTQRHLAKSSSSFAKSMEKLSSGLRINRAGDDAAGLAISEGLKADIRALDQASRNAQAV